MRGELNGVGIKKENCAKEVNITHVQRSAVE